MGGNGALGLDTNSSFLMAGRGPEGQRVTLLNCQQVGKQTTPGPGNQGSKLVEGAWR